jgi:hypothetical protein
VGKAVGVGSFTGPGRHGKRMKVHRSYGEMKIDTESYDRVVGREKFRTEKEGAKKEGTKMACGKNDVWEKTLVSPLTLTFSTRTSRYP